ncbi:MAG TPA: DUF6519 domain-containing protein [Gemmatimonadales bacterium]|jgi:hypothetical protein
MKGDFSRVTFDPTKHFCQVLKQQGRVTLDADDNEQSAILLHYIRRLAWDLLGPHAVPAGHGFELAVNASGLHLTRGHCYVDGILVENDADDWSYTTQKDYPLSDNDPLQEQIKIHQGLTFWIYLDVWERFVTPLDDDDIREKALGGPDTCGRAKVVWQVKASPYDPGMPAIKDFEPCATPMAGWHGLSEAQLAARVDPGKKSEDPCVLPPDSKYRGAENQLYRVEIHEGGHGDEATFKWSRDNGSVTAAWTDTSGNDLVVSRTRGLKAGDWVELSDDTRELQGEPGVLVKLVKVEGDLLSVDPATVPAEGIGWSEKLRTPKVRRWDQIQTEDVILSNGAVPVTETPAGADEADVVWIDLEDGIQVQFLAGGEYRTGDYWLIPARVATGAIEWPSEMDADSKVVPTMMRPRGIEHHYAPLGFVQWQGEDVNLQTCRCEITASVECARVVKQAEPDMSMKRTVKASKAKGKTPSTGGRRHRG